MTNKDEHHPPLKKSSKVRFFTAFRGEKNIMWLSEDYQLQPHDKDSERDRYFLKQEQSDFIKHPDTRKTVVDGITVYIKFNCDKPSDKAINRIASRIVNKQNRKVNFSD